MTDKADRVSARTHGGPRSERKLTRREFVGVAAGTTLALLLPGCRRAASPQRPSREPTQGTGTVRYGRPRPWRMGRSGRGDISSWIVMFSAHIEYGIKEKYAECFHDYISISANWDPNKQIEDIRTLLKEGIDLLLIDPLSHPVVEAGIRQAMDAGVPVILACDRVQGAQYVSSVARDERARGAACADWICRSVPGGRVAIMLSVPASGDSKAWLAGVRSGLGASPDVQEVALERCPWSSLEAEQAMSFLLNESPRIDAVIVNNGVLGRGVVHAFAARGSMPPPIAGVDDWNGWLRTATEHEVRFLGLSGGANLGLRCVELAASVLAGEPVPHHVQFPYQTFDESNLDHHYRPDLTDHYWAINDPPHA